MDTTRTMRDVLVSIIKEVREGLLKRGWKCCASRIYSWTTQQDVTRRDPLCQICELLEAIYDVRPARAWMLANAVVTHLREYSERHIQHHPATSALLAEVVKSHANVVTAYTAQAPIEIVERDTREFIAAGERLALGLARDRRALAIEQRAVAA